MENWGEAQKAVLDRLAKVRKLVESQDEGGVMALLNQQDAFCDAAQLRRASDGASSQEPKCSFCEGSLQSDGCLDRLGSINQAVLDGRWDKAGVLVDEYVAWVKGLSV